MSPPDQQPNHEAPEEMILGANLEEFAQRVSIIVSLESSGKIASDEAYSKIKKLWRQVKSSRKSLGLTGKPNNQSDFNDSTGI